MVGQSGNLSRILFKVGSNKKQSHTPWIKGNTFWCFNQKYPEWDIDPVNLEAKGSVFNPWATQQERSEIF